MNPTNNQITPEHFGICTNHPIKSKITFPDLTELLEFEPALVNLENWLWSNFRPSKLKISSNIHPITSVIMSPIPASHKWYTEAMEWVKKQDMQKTQNDYDSRYPDGLTSLLLDDQFICKN